MDNVLPVQASGSSGQTSEIPKASEILKQSWQMFKEKPKLYVLISASPILATMFSAFVFGLIGALGKSMELGLVIVILMTGFVFILLMFLYLWSMVSLLIAIKNHSTEITFVEAYKQSWHYLGAVLGAGLLTVLAVLGGIILFVVPGIYFALIFTFSQFVAIDDHTSPVDSLKASKALVSGRIGQMAKKSLYFGILTLLLSIVIGIVDGLLGGILPFLKTTNIFGLIFNLVWGPLGIIYSFMVYRYFRSTYIQPTVAQTAPVAPTAPVA